MCKWFAGFGGAMALSSTCVAGPITPIRTVASAEYAANLQVDDVSRGCDWNTVLVSHLVQESKGLVVVGSRDKAPGKTLTIKTIELIAPNVAAKRTNSITVRADLLEDDKLIGTVDVSEEDSVKASKPFCEALRGLGEKIGGELADWVEDTKFPTCSGTCVGIHPDEPIFTAPQVVEANSDAVNDTVKGCGWLSYMVKKVAKEFNENDPIPRAKLKIADAAGTTSLGRKLTLRVDNIHVIGGGGFTGPKWISMLGELTDGGMLVGSFEAFTRDRNGLTTCGVLDSMSDSMADNIAKWLKAPSIGAKL